MPVVTIGRMYGAGGETIGALVARRLGAELVDRKIFEEVARQLEMPPEEVEQHEESPGSFLSRVLRALGSASVEFAAPPEAAAWTPPYSDTAFDTRKAVVQITEEVIREAARTGNAVIVGRGAAYVLGARAGSSSGLAGSAGGSSGSPVNAFVRASEAARVEHVRAVEVLGEDEARRRVRQVDANRAAYVKQVYGHDWLQAGHYHLVVDSGKLGYERAAEVILAAAGGGH